jgi:hypothetical protein
MYCDLENSFLLIYLSGPLIRTHGPRGAAPADSPLNGHAFIYNNNNKIGYNEQSITLNRCYIPSSPWSVYQVWLYWCVIYVLKRLHVPTQISLKVN